MNLKADTARVAILKTVRDAIDVELSNQRDTTLIGLLEARETLGVKSVEVTLPDGTKVATASLVEPKGPRIVVTSETVLMKWVQARWPDQVVPQVRPAFLTQLLNRFVDEGGGDVVDTSTGELVDGVTAYPAKGPSTFTIRYLAGGREAIADAWRGGALADLVGTPAIAIEAGAPR